MSELQQAAGAAPGAGLPRLELRVERLQLTFRFTFAFHAREVRFEVDSGSGYERVFPETFSFHATRHDPTELFLQLDDLLTQPRVLGEHANARDTRSLMTRLLSAAPRYLDGLRRHLIGEGRLGDAGRMRFHQDVALLSQLLLRFTETRELDGGRQLRIAAWSLRRSIFECLRVLVSERVDAAYFEAYVRGEVDPVDPSDDPTESGFFQVLESGEVEAANRMILRLAERSFYLWLEGVCLDEENQAFEKEDSPFADRESEVLSAISATGEGPIDRSQDLVPFLRRGGRDCQRILGKLERWFLRCYDIQHSSAMIHQAAHLTSGQPESDRHLSWHTPANHLGLLGMLLLPLLASAVAYPVSPRLFDLLCSLEVLTVNGMAIWFLLYRFCWKRDLSFFHASVPRIAAGIIVGYLPVFLIDEVWDLASRPWVNVTAVIFVLGLVTLLYIYVEVARRIPDRNVAFSRARSVFLLGVVQALGFGIMMTNLVGPFMVVRNWSPASGEVAVETLRGGGLAPVIGELPQIVGSAPFFMFPSALLLMTFLSFFIGIFLQLMWEELPITEPL